VWLFRCVDCVVGELFSSVSGDVVVSRLGDMDMDG